ncbi:MAG: hypothetical protein JWN79_2137 [Gemmatimonadetes bacterium]|jgi:uncharacterized repeat protein (TIGR01451 family)|nr:hypothetical protein [Gemmatimonadota bacterium]
MTRLARLLLASSAITLTAAVPARAQTAAAHAAAPSLVVAALNTTAAAERAARPRTSVRPNDVLRYTLTFTNPTSRALASVELKDAIPAGVRFVGGSTHASRADARAEFSADGGKSWSTQPMETVMVAGQPVQRAVSADRYTHVRWTVAGKVAPGATVTADFEAKVDGAGA